MKQVTWGLFLLVVCSASHAQAAEDDHAQIRGGQAAGRCRSRCSGSTA